VATVKGLAFGTERPVAPVPTLAALALRAPVGQGPVVALLDARRGEYYAAVFELEGSDAPRALTPAEGVYTPEALAPELPERCTLVGEAVPLCGEALRELVGPGVVLGPADDAGAAAVGVLGQRLLASGQGVSADSLVPRYVRRAEAEVQRLGQRFE
jgi:tRNA threonylcarbamoyladenosine biosynthesis protein TsaB